MIGKKVSKMEAHHDTTGYIGKGIYVEGLLKYSGSMRIEGHFKGRIDGEGFLIIGDGALVEGEIHVDNALVSGEVKGSIVAHTKVELRKPAHICGDITALTLVIGEGVVLEGNCLTMKSAEKALGALKANNHGGGEKK